jgi:hypothetical protein
MKRLLLVLFLSLVTVAGLAQAQDLPTLSNLKISLWPEFDRPEALVIHRGLFADDTPLPVPVEIRIPARVGQPTAVAYVGEEGQRFNQEHTTRVEGDWLVVAFELPTLGYQLEYYDALSQDSAGQRQYTYDYVADYSVAALNLEIQEPPTAESFVLDPPADSVATEGDGLVYHFVDEGSLAQGEERSWTFTYQKDNEDLTVSAFVQPETQTSAPPPPAPGNDNSAVWIFLVAFLTLVAVGAGAFWLGRRTQPISEPAPARRQKRRGSGRGMPPQGQAALFCHQCGAELRPDSDFCHKCGTTVRTV